MFLALLYGQEQRSLPAKYKLTGSNLNFGKGQGQGHEVQEHINQNFYHVGLFDGHSDYDTGNGLYR